MSNWLSQNQNIYKDTTIEIHRNYILTKHSPGIESAMSRRGLSKKQGISKNQSNPKNQSIPKNQTNTSYNPMQSKLKNYKASAIRTKQKLFSLILNNFNKDAFVLCLTFADTNEFDITSASDCNSKFHNFITMVNRKFNDFRYVAVISVQTNRKLQAIHYHLTCNIKPSDTDALVSLWNYGGTSIIKLNNIVGHCKYMSKNIDEYLIYKHSCTNPVKSRSIFYSKGLNTPVIETPFNCTDIEGHLDNVRYIQDNFVSNNKVIYKNTYNNLPITINKYFYTAKNNKLFPPLPQATLK